MLPRQAFRHVVGRIQAAWMHDMQIDQWGACATSVF
jgi:hypothetical protein